jgi:uncharacterized protein (UPF0332 family)
MSDNKRRTLARYRIERAGELLEAAKVLLYSGHYKDNINRSYYSIFNTMRSMLALDGFDAKKHYGVISEFRKNYIKTALFDVEFSVYIEDAFEIRNDSDYDDMFSASRDDAMEQISHAQAIFDAIVEYLNNLS